MPTHLHAVHGAVDLVEKLDDGQAIVKKSNGVNACVGADLLVELIDKTEDDPERD